MTDGSTTPAVSQQSTVTLRPDRSLLVLVPLLLILAVPSWWFAIQLELSSLHLFSVVLTWYAVVVALHVVAGRTTVGPDGVATRRFGQAIVPWTEIERITVDDLVILRMVTLKRKGSPDVPLAVPRLVPPFGARRFAEQVAILESAWRQHRPDAAVTTGKVFPLPVRIGFFLVTTLLAPTMILIIMDRPWFEPWWPGVHEARAVPRACDVVPKQLVTRAVGTEMLGLGDGEGRGCQWENKGTGPQYWDGRRVLTLRYSLYERSSRASGTDEAREVFAREVATATDPTGRLAGHRKQPTSTEIHDVGDEAVLVRGTSPGDETVEAMEVHVRRANVVIVVSYTTRAVPPDERRDVALAVAKAAAAAVVLD